MSTRPRVHGAGAPAEAPVRLGRVAIVGAGQVGTSLGMALRDAPSVAEVALFDSDRDALAASLGRGGGHRALRSLDEAFAADSLVLAVPVSEILRTVDGFGARLRPGSFVIDTGSAKAAVVEAMRRSVPGGVHAIGGHPMAGTPVPGPRGADPGGLRAATFVLTPVREDAAALASGRALVEAVGATPVVLDAAVHDRVVARTSHLPHLMAFALASVADRAAANGDPVRELAATGFSGAVRLAHSDPAMVAAFLAANATEVRGAVAEFRAALDQLTRALDDDEEPLGAALARAARSIEVLP